jgi:hypothetical protein
MAGKITDIRMRVWFQMKNMTDVSIVMKKDNENKKIH